ncbi:glycoside hydrolase family 3 N-terminal domain-containing protein [Streptomyces sp. NPDC051322]|uniref:glycoside hydrolase family 3 N-terminal domain-containing protein n=1 Tax=Streptomyces sp. NPDC051322 TaxID=3154645 RepID=UPI00344E0C38
MSRAAGLKSRLVVLLLGTAITATACGGGGSAGGSSSGSTRSTATAERSSSPTGASSSAAESPSPGAAAGGSCVSRVLAGMTTAQRVGQLFMSAVSSSGPTATELDVLRRDHVGSVILMGHTTKGADSVKSVTQRVQSTAPKVAGTQVGMLVSADQEGGQIQVLTGPGFSTMPSAVTQGSRPTAQLQQNATQWGRQLKGAGVGLNLAPVVDVVPADQTSVNQPIGVLSREYGHTPATVARQSSAFVRGMGKAGVLTTLKHFPSLGHVRGNTDFSADVTDDVTTVDGEFIQTYRSGIRAGAQFVMIALVSYTKIDPHQLAVFSPKVLRTLLRDKVGFHGVVISDDMGKAVAVQSVPAGQRATGFLSSGGDMVLTVDPSTVHAMTSAVLAKVKSDAAFRKSVDASVRRILAAKAAAGLLNCPS